MCILGEKFPGNNKTTFIVQTEARLKNMLMAPKLDSIQEDGLFQLEVETWSPVVGWLVDLQLLLGCTPYTP